MKDLCPHCKWSKLPNKVEGSEVNGYVRTYICPTCKQAMGVKKVTVPTLEKAIGLPNSDQQFLRAQLESCKPKVIVEIGARNGGSSLLFGDYCKKNGGVTYSIDPARLGGWNNTMNNWGVADVVIPINEHSPWFNHFDIIKEPIDFLFIDGNHNMPFIVADYIYWIHYIRMGGLICFHDTWEGSGQKYLVRDFCLFIEEQCKFCKLIGESHVRHGVMCFQKISDPKDNKYMPTEIDDTTRLWKFTKASKK